MRKYRTLTPDSGDTDQRTDFSEPRPLHLPIHRTALILSSGGKKEIKIYIYNGSSKKLEGYIVSGTNKTGCMNACLF